MVAIIDVKHEKIVGLVKMLQQLEKCLTRRLGKRLGENEELVWTATGDNSCDPEEMQITCEVAICGERNILNLERKSFKTSLTRVVRISQIFYVELFDGKWLPKAEGGSPTSSTIRHSAKYLSESLRKK